MVGQSSPFGLDEGQAKSGVQLVDAACVFEGYNRDDLRFPMLTFLLWCVLFVLCWPLALVALILYPILWLLLLPFRILGVAVDGILDLVRALFSLPSRLLGARPAR
jgi:hypothetical protein